MTKTRHTSRNSNIKMIGHLFEESIDHEKDFNLSYNQAKKHTKIVLPIERRKSTQISQQSVYRWPIGATYA